MSRDDIERLLEKIRQVAYQLHVYLGTGLLEKVYENGLKHRLEKLGLDVEAQKPLKVYDEDGELLGDYFADLMVENQIVVELKAVKAITNEHYAQILNYLKITGAPAGLLINFGSYKFEVRTVVPRHDRVEGVGRDGQPCRSVESVDGGRNGQPCRSVELVGEEDWPCRSVENVGRDGQPCRSVENVEGCDVRKAMGSGCAEEALLRRTAAQARGRAHERSVVSARSRAEPQFYTSTLLHGKNTSVTDDSTRSTRSTRLKIINETTH